jgi:hypothetical protein
MRISTAPVKKRDLNHSKLKDFKARLLDVIARRVKPNDPDLAKLLRREVLTAPIDAFRLNCGRSISRELRPAV